MSATTTQLHEIVRKSRSTVNWWNHRGRWALHSRHQSCAALTSAKRERVCTMARKSLAWHSQRVQRASRRLWLTLPSPSDWTVAVRVAQRAYPGTDGWLLSCSASEGGHGSWVWNRHGSGAGGWAQFMESTFWRMFNAARADVTQRGFSVPSSAASFRSPLGQALAAAWGYTNGRRHEWSGSGC